MEYSEKWGKDVDSAVELALKDLKLTIDEVDVIVLEEPTKGFLGIGSKLAKVKVVKKGAKIEETEPMTEEEIFDYGTKDLRNTKKEERKDAKNSRDEAPNNRGRDGKKNNKKIEYSEEDLIKTGEIQSIIANRPEDLEPLTEHTAIDFLKETTEKMGVDLEITGEGNADTLYLNMEGKDAGTIIGKRGQTLDAIQYLTSLVVNKDEDGYIRVVVDAENYRAKREKTLQELAARLGNKVIKTGRTVRLEPMNPYERMVIHATLHGSDKITTRSEGEEPYRRVIIEKK